MALWRLAWRQARGAGALALVASLGVLLAVALLAVGPIYLGALERLAFDQSLRDLRNNFHPQVFVPYSTFQPDEYQRARNTVGEASRAALGRTVEDQGAYASTRLMQARPEDPPGFQAPAFLQYRSDLADHIQVIEGRLPGAGTGTLIEVAMGQSLARRLGYRTGQRFRLDTGLPAPAPAFEAVLTGIIAPRVLTEEFWLGQGAVYFESYTVNDQWVLALFVTEDTLLQQVGAAAPALLGEVNDFLYLDRKAVLAAGPSKMGAALLDLEARLSPALPQARLFAGLQGSVQSYQRQSSLSRTPLLILLVFVEGVALYALVLVALALSRRQEDSVALLRSRGAGVSRAVAVVLFWGIGLAGLSLVLAPAAGAGTVALLGFTPAWSLITDSTPLLPGPLAPALPWTAFGALLAGILLLLPSTGVMRIPLAVLRRRQGRPSGPLFFQRLFLDAALLALAGAVLWQVQRRGGVLAPTASADAGVDRAALLVPVLASVVGLLLFFRLLPLLVRFGSWSTRRSGPLGLSLALERVARAPGPFLALGGLLLVVATLGTFAATFGGTLDRSASEQAAYVAGADALIRRPEGFSGLSFEEVRRRVRAVPEIEGAAAAYRTNAGLGSVTVGIQAPLLALDPAPAASILWSREDFAQEPVPDLLARLALIEGSRARPRTAPENTVAIGIWARPEDPARNRFLWLHILDSTGTPYTYTLGPLDFTEWRFLETPLAQGAHPAPPGPYTVDSIQIYETAFGATGAPGALRLDDLQAQTMDGRKLVLDSFDRHTEWLPILTTGGRRDVVESRAEGGEHSSVLRFQWGRETRDGVRGIYVSPASRNVPILASPDFLAVAQLAAGGEGALHIAGRVVPVRVAGILDQFPTIEPGPTGFAVADGPTLLAHLNAVNVGRPVWPNEIFLDLPDDPARRASALATLAKQPEIAGAVVERLAVQAERQRSPLDSAGWRGLALLALLAAFAALAIGIAAHVSSSAEERRAEAALLRALGLSRRRALFAFLVEHMLVASLGTVCGVALGLWLSSVIIPLLQGQSGVPVVPPLALTTDWRVVGLVLGAIAAGSLAAALLLWRTFLTVPVAGVLRVGRQ